MPGHYASIPEPHSAFVGTVEDFTVRADELAAAHRAFVSLAAKAPSGAPRTGSPFRRSHSAGLVEYARTEVQCPARSSAFRQGGGDAARAVLSVAALEGGAYELQLTARTRNGPLREAALEASRGVCEACGVDYSCVLDGLGLSALQVHHKVPLAQRDEATLTHMSDLAVLCANCHAMVHADRDVAMEVTTLADRWSGSRTTAA